MSFPYPIYSHRIRITCAPLGNSKRPKWEKLGYHSSTLHMSLSLFIIQVCTTILANDLVSIIITAILLHQQNHLG